MRRGWTAALVTAAVAGCTVGAPLEPSDDLSVSADGPWVQVSVGGAHACALDGEGRLACWGSNGHGQLGFEGPGTWPAPRRVPGGAWRHVAAGGTHTCAVDLEGRAWCWGGNDVGQLGDGTRVDRPRPTLVALTLRSVEVVAGGTHSCALGEQGQIVCWGGSLQGQVGGRGRADEWLPPTLVAGGPWGALAAGAGHTCALAVTGGAYCWGGNASGEVGAGVQLAARVGVSRVGGVSHLRAVGAGTATSCALDDKGHVLCWGDNGQRQVTAGSGNPGSPTLRWAGAAAAVDGGEGWVCALEVSGEARCWGRRWGAHAGDLPQPTQEDGGWVVPLGGGATLSVGDRHACAVMRDGKLRCWGDASGGRLGAFAP